MCLNGKKSWFSHFLEKFKYPREITLYKMQKNILKFFILQ
jgi:hypothetical protein